MSAMCCITDVEVFKGFWNGVLMSQNHNEFQRFFLSIHFYNQFSRGYFPSTNHQDIPLWCTYSGVKGRRVIIIAHNRIVLKILYCRTWKIKQ
jgi:hypothetical protein